MIVATYQTVEARFYFRVDDSQLVGMCLFARDDRDPGELLFLDYETAAERLLPRKVISRFADQDVETLTLERFNFAQ